MEDNKSDLYEEYLLAINKKVTSISKDVVMVKQGLETQPQIKDYSLQLESIAAAVQVLRMQVAKPAEQLAAPTPAAAPALDVSRLAQQLGEVVREEVKRHHAGYVMTKWVWYGTAVLIGLAMVASVMAAGWWQAAHDRDHYVRSNWFWRSLKQTDKHYANELLEVWHQDSVKFQQKVEQREANELLLLQADRKKQEEAALRVQAAHSMKR
jgi:hypothetical protein